MPTLFETNIRNYWNYYLELESEFYQTKRYVEFDSSNNSTFSIEFLKLYEAVCSEIDVLGKYVASLVDPQFIPDKNTTFYRWWIVIQDSLSIRYDINKWYDADEPAISICDSSLHNYTMDIALSPWKGFKLEFHTGKDNKQRIRRMTNCETPKWWADYTLVKHQRTQRDDSSGEINFKKANLENLSNAIAALYSLELAALELSISDISEAEGFINESLLFQKKAFATSRDFAAMFQNQEQ